MAGWYLEDFEIGTTYKSIARTITECDVVNFAGLSGDFNPLHMDEEYGKNVSIFKKRVAHGMLGPSGDDAYGGPPYQQAGQRNTEAGRQPGEPGGQGDNRMQVDPDADGKRIGLTRGSRLRVSEGRRTGNWIHTGKRGEGVL